MRFLIQILLNAGGMLVAAYLIPGITFGGSIFGLLLAGLIIGLINLIVRPIVVLLSLPAIILTLGIFYLLINGFLMWLAGALVPGLTVAGCLPAILGGLVMALFNWIVGSFAED